MGYSVQQRAERVATFRWLEVQLMEMLARWVPTTPEMEVKVLFGRHVWDCARHADSLGRRAFELRAPLHYTLPATPACQSWLSAVAGLESTQHRVGAFYEIVCPFIVGWYRHYLAQTDPLMDEPTVRLIDAALIDYERFPAERDRLVGAEPWTGWKINLPPAILDGATLTDIVVHSPDHRRARGVPA